MYGYCLDDPVNLIDPEGLKSEPIENAEIKSKKSQYYWTVTPKPGACEKCQDMAEIKFPQKPERPHPNCKCLIQRHGIESKDMPSAEKISWFFTKGYLIHCGGKSWEASSGSSHFQPLPKGMYNVGNVVRIPKKGGDRQFKLLR